MSRFFKSIIYPFRIFGEDTQKASLWFLFTVICGLIGIAVNVWSHLSSEVNLYHAILQEFSVNSFYTYSIVLLTCTAGELFMKIDKEKMITYTTIKEWLLIVLGGFVFIGAFLCQSREKLTGFNWYQLFYFIFTVLLAVYGFCVVNLDRHPDLFVDIQDPLSPKEAEEIKGMIEKMSQITTDNKGNNV